MLDVPERVKKGGAGGVPCKKISAVSLELKAWGGWKAALRQGCREDTRGGPGFDRTEQLHFENAGALVQSNSLILTLPHGPK